MCRVLERIISKQLNYYLKSNYLLTKNQYGFYKCFYKWKINRIAINKMFKMLVK